MEPDKPTMLEYLISEGYTEYHVFPGEYTLLVNPKTLGRIRLYENGAVWKSNTFGYYEKIVERDES